MTSDLMDGGRDGNTATSSESSFFAQFSTLNISERNRDGGGNSAVVFVVYWKSRIRKLEKAVAVSGVF